MRISTMLHVYGTKKKRELQIKMYILFRQRSEPDWSVDAFYECIFFSTQIQHEIVRFFKIILVLIFSFYLPI